jgi:hypothetical protein
MSMSTLIYIEFIDNAIHSTWNIVSIAWVIFSSTNKMASSESICLSPMTNNIVKYSVIIELLYESLALGIYRLVVKMDSN